jgi:hypothetical protein
VRLEDDVAAPGTPSVAELVGGAALLALVPATADLDLAAAMAWDFARTAASTGRRVALVDCYVDEPQLHAAAGEKNQEGIVDVFEYGCSLSRIARQQPQENLYFVPAGTFAPDPAVMMAHPRWRRLSAGFRHEDATMLLFLPAECIGPLAGILDGLVALAPDGAEAGLASTPEIQAAVDGGVPLLATLTGLEDLDAAPPAAPAPEAEIAPAATVAPAAAPGDAASAPESSAPESEEAEPAILMRRRRTPGQGAWRVRLMVYGTVAVVGAATVAASYRRELGLGDLGLSRLGGGSGRDSEPPMRTVPAFRTLVPRAVDSLPFAVQVSAWTSLAFALDAGDALEGKGLPPIVAPIRLGARTWYRVYAGPVATQDAADSLLGAVRAAGLDRPGSATTVLVPLSVALRRVANVAAARAERARLRAAGIPAFTLGQADGAYRLFAGAYAAPKQAAYLDSLVTSTGSAGQLGPRVGFHP